MTNEGVAKDDVRLPESELGSQIQNDFEAGKDLLVTIISAMGEEQVRSVLSSSPPTLNSSHFPCRPSPIRRPPKANDSRVFVLVFGT